MKARARAREIAAQLTAAGIPDADIEAEVLVRHALGIDRAAFYLDPPLDAGIEERLACFAARRLAREPLAYITGRREFYGLEFAVTPAVLIPRPETELLVDLALSELDVAPGAKVLDVGTGSGSIAIAIDRHRRDAGPMAATDVSAAAMDVAVANARRLQARVRFVRCHLAGAIVSADIVVANLPYIPAGDLEALEPEVRDREPQQALFGGDDGLDLIRSLVSDCGERLRPRLLALEVAAGQACKVASLLHAAGAVEVRTQRDLAGIERVVSGRWQA